MSPVLHVICWMWGAWITLNLLMVALCATVLPPRQPCFDGFRVRIPRCLPLTLETAEIAAIIAHERGHRHYRHIWVNLTLTCCFVSISMARRRRLEFEADDYAARGGHALALASALEKMSSHWFDIERAQRLRNRYA